MKQTKKELNENEIHFDDFSSYQFFMDKDEKDEIDKNLSFTDNEKETNSNAEQYEGLCLNTFLPINQKENFELPNNDNEFFIQNNRKSMGSFSTFSSGMNSTQYSIAQSSNNKNAKQNKNFQQQYINSSNFSNMNGFHSSMPFKQPNYYFTYNQIIPTPLPPQTQHRSYPQFGNNNNFYGSISYNYNQPINAFTNNTIINNFIYINSQTPPQQKNKSTKGEQKNKNNSSKKDKNFNSLNELLDSLKGGKHISNFIKSRTNTELMIQLIRKLSTQEIEELIEMIKHKLKDIMISNNKFSQKLFEQCTSEQRLTILTEIKDIFIEIAMNKWGSYSLQALIKVVSLPEEQEIIKKCIEGKIYELAMDKQANFVLQKLILILNEKGMTQITEEIFHIFHHLIYNSIGIGLLKNLVLTNKSSEMRKKFVLKVIENLTNIINNQVGHTLLLQMMDKWDYETCKPMITEIYKEIIKYSYMKYSSLVILRCIKITEPKILSNISGTIIKTESLYELLSCENGKGIIKTLFQKLPTKKRTEFYSNIKNSLKCILEKNKNLSNPSLAFLNESA